ncbi:MAG TPA: hypothetical protein P5571_06215 [Candidatus Krumholzibacteria bacterium]|nr:hypothetical protein [Candidatus Krumholzibacteria bacterium]HRX50936.1 hypothetical protein [Candidatus Krumholzibacteria bacterium]
MAWSELMADNGIVGWGVAFLLAVGGTAVVVAAWLQFRSTWKSLPAPVKAMLGTRAPRARAAKAAAPTPPAPSAERPREQRDPGRAVRAYRGQAETPAAPAPEPAAPAAPPPAPAVPAHALSMEDLDAYLTRLHRAVDELEAAAGAPS